MIASGFLNPVSIAFIVTVVTKFPPALSPASKSVFPFQPNLFAFFKIYAYA